MRYKILIAALALASACTAPNQRRDTSDWKTPYETIQLAATEAPRRVPGKFSVHIKAAASQGGVTYLNTELDYRDQRNLTIVLTSKAVLELQTILGSPPETGLIGKRLLVYGKARRVRIAFIADGLVTDKYYYQTHVKVSRADQIEVLSDL